MVLGSRFIGSEVQGFMVQYRRSLLASSLINKRNFEKENIEYRIMNFEGMYSIYLKRLSAAIPSFEIRYSIFCGSAVRF